MLSFTTFCVFLPWNNVARRSPIIANGKITRVADPTQIAAPVTREFPKIRLLMAAVGDLPDVTTAESGTAMKPLALDNLVLRQPRTFSRETPSPS